MKKGQEIVKTIFYRLQFIDSAIFMTSSLLIINLINNLLEGIHKIECKYKHDNKNCETSQNKYKNCECFLEHTSFKFDLTKYKCLCCNKNYQKKLD